MSGNDEYRLEPRHLGIGGYAEVFAATHKHSGARVALKRLKRSVSPQEHAEALSRMRREIETLEKVSHPHVMPLIAFAPDYTWYTMPIAAQVLSKLQRPILTDVLLTIVRACAAGLAIAHARGHIHRDVTPANIMEIETAGYLRWVIADFGSSDLSLRGGKPLGSGHAVANPRPYQGF
jgi:serine/threonine protein kinase